MNVNTIVWATDPHLSFCDNPSNFFKKVNKNGDVFLVTGDISDGVDIKTRLIDLSSEVNKPIYFVLGNHDFYYRSMKEVHGIVSRLCHKRDNLHWMNEAGVVKLNDNVALIGHDSWYDARFGDINGGVVLNDFYLIRDLKPVSRFKDLLIEKCRELAQESANYIHRVLSAAIKEYKKVILIIHVPPFKEAAWYMGTISEPSYLPWFSSKIIGEVIEKIMSKHPDKELLVLCGHTHSGGVINPQPNIKVITGKSDYYFPDIQELIGIYNV